MGFNALTKEIKEELQRKGKDELLEECLKEWRESQAELSKYPNTKSKQHKEILSKIKVLQNKIFAIRTSQITLG